MEYLRARLVRVLGDSYELLPLAVSLDFVGIVQDSSLSLSASRNRLECAAIHQKHRR